MPPRQKTTDDVSSGPEAEVSPTPVETTGRWLSPALSECPVDGYVPARWVDVQQVFNRAQGLICYGDPIWVPAEQLDDDPRLVPWDGDWFPDPAALAASQLEG